MVWILVINPDPPKLSQVVENIFSQLQQGDDSLQNACQQAMQGYTLTVQGTQFTLKDGLLYREEKKYTINGQLVDAAPSSADPRH